MHDFSGVGIFFQRYPTSMRRPGSAFALVHGDVMQEAWLISPSDRVLPNDFCARFNAKPEHTQAFTVAVLGGASYMQEQYLNFHPGFLGARMFLAEEPARCGHINCRVCWPKVVHYDNFCIAIFSPDEALGKNARVTNKIVEVDGRKYVVQFFMRTLHVYATEEDGGHWLGCFKAVTNGGKVSFVAGQHVIAGSKRVVTPTSLVAAQALPF